MGYCLMIMNPREIKKVYESINAIDCPKVWFRAYNSIDIVPVMNEFVNKHKFDHYIVTSDDLVINKKAFNLNIENLTKYEVFSGYCHLYIGSPHVCLSLEKPTLKNGLYPDLGDINFMKYTDVKNMPTDIFRTYMMGYSVASITRELWLKYPFIKYIVKSKKGLISGASSDHHFSYRLNKDNIPMYSHKLALHDHLKPPFHDPKDKRAVRGQTLTTNWLVGNQKSETILDL